MKSTIFKKLFACLLIFVILLQNPIETRSKKSKSLSKTKTKTKVFPIIAGGLAFLSLCKLMSSGKCQKSQAELTNEKVAQDLSDRTVILLKIISTRSELNSLKPHILEHISLFIGIIPIEFIKTHGDFISSYANCYIDQEKLISENQRTGGNWI